jgi:hypothetical protein
MIRGQQAFTTVAPQRARSRVTGIKLHFLVATVHRGAGRELGSREFPLERPASSSGAPPPPPSDGLGKRKGPKVVTQPGREALAAATALNHDRIPQ